VARTGNPRIERLISGAAVGITIGALAVIASVARPSVLERGEFWTYDVRARAAASPETASKDIVILEITEQDLEDAENAYGVSWPWPRAIHGYLAAYAAKAGAKVVLYDWLFQDHGPYSVNDAEDFASSMREAGNVVIGLALTKTPQVQRKTEGPWVARLKEFETEDEARVAARQLAAWNTRTYLVGKTLYYGGKASPKDVVVTWQRLMGLEELASMFDPPEEPVPLELPAADLEKEITIESTIALRDGLELDAPGVHLQERAGLDPPLAPIAAAPARTGNVYQDIEADGIMRRQTPLVRHDGRLFPSLPLAAYLVAHPDVTPRFDGSTLVLGDRRVPLDDEGRVGIRYHGAGIYPHVRSFEVLHSQALLDDGQGESAVTVPFELLRGKYVIVSASGQALRDIRVTPMSKFQEGAEVNATALDNLEQGNFIVRAARSTDGVIAFLLCVLVAVGMVFLWSSIPRASLALLATFGATALVLVGFWLIADHLFVSRGLWIGVATPVLFTSMAAFASLLVTSASERRGRRFVQEALGKYTSPELVRELMAHPEYLSLEWGERRPMSVYFSDIAGFTSFSETLSPEQLVKLLNDYLTSMTDIVLQHGGVVDKYIGDAVMAFWGAPLKDPDHARKAVRCALAMRRKCVELRPVWQAEYGTEVRARAGVNSGGAVVGNMGSKHKYNYTVMGDMVNLASRLEGANKPYGTYLMISEFTYAEVAEIVDVRELDLLTVKGKEQPVRVFEVLEEKGRTAPEVLRGAACFGEGLALYRARDFAAAIPRFEAAVVETPADEASVMYIERCRHFLEEPPDASWDGVWRLAEK
jgi:adenylate cyclase